MQLLPARSGFATSAWILGIREYQGSVTVVTGNRVVSPYGSLGKSVPNQHPFKVTALCSVRPEVGAGATAELFGGK